MIKIYGIKRSRAFRCLWMLEELGVPYEQVEIPTREASGNEDYLRLNPNGRVPTLVDGDFVLFESQAINLYLAEKYGAESEGGLWPRTPEDRGRAAQWALWGATEVEEALLIAMRNRQTAPPEQRDEALAAAAEERLQRPLRALERSLADRAFLLGKAFTVADLNLASIFVWARFGRIALEPYPAVATWIKTCLERPARARSVA